MKLKLEVTLVPEFGDTYPEGATRVFRAEVSDRHGSGDGDNITPVELKAGKYHAARYDRYRHDAGYSVPLWRLLTSRLWPEVALQLAESSLTRSWTIEEAQR